MSHLPAEFDAKDIEIAASFLAEAREKGFRVGLAMQECQSFIFCFASNPSVAKKHRAWKKSFVAWTRGHEEELAFAILRAREEEVIAADNEIDRRQASAWKN